MKDDLVEAVKVYTRYDYITVGKSLDGEVETRRQKNERVGFADKNPELNIPINGYQLWNIFFELVSCVDRRDSNTGYFNRIPPTEYKAYSDLKCLDIQPYEFEILIEMDTGYCEEMNKEVSAKHEKVKEVKK